MSMSMGAESGVSIAEFSFHCYNLRNKDWLSKSDPFICFFVQPVKPDDIDAVTDALNFQRSHLPPVHKDACVPERMTCATGGSEAIWHYISETEVVWDTLSPAFVTKFRLPYALIARLRFRLEIYDMDKYEAPLHKQDFLGSMQYSMKQLVHAQNSTHDLCDKKGRTKASLGRVRIAVDRYNFARYDEAKELKMDVKFSQSSGIPPSTQVFFVLSRTAPLPNSNSNGRRNSNASGKQGHTNGAAAPGVNVVNITIDTATSTECDDWVQIYRSGALASPSVKREWSFQNTVLRLDGMLAGDNSRYMRLELFLHKQNGNHMRIGGTRSFTLAMILDKALAYRQRLVPDVVSGAALRSGEYSIVTSGMRSPGSTSPARRTSGDMFGYATDAIHSYNSNNYSNNNTGGTGPMMFGQQQPVPLASKSTMTNGGSRDSSSSAGELDMAFSFSNFLWWPAAQKKGGLFRQLSDRGSRR